MMTEMLFTLSSVAAISQIWLLNSWIVANFIKNWSVNFSKQKEVSVPIKLMGISKKIKPMRYIKCQET